MQSLPDFKSSFKKTNYVKALLIPTTLIKTFQTNFKDYILIRPKKPCIVKDFIENSCKLLLLSNEISTKNQNEWPEALNEFILSNKIEIRNHEIIEDYDDFNMVDILSMILPKNVIVPSGFEIIGTIAHLNLRGEQINYKNIIGQVLLDKNPLITTVVNKTEAIHKIYRNADVEIIAGENSLETELKEGGCIFKLCYDKVYWNSRLQYERDRILELFKPGENVLDLFCGIGPLCIRAAKKGCNVIGNDLNPDCYKYLQINAKLNKLKFPCFNLDARDCFLQLVSPKENDINKELQQKNKNISFDHVYMNLPGDAIEFLDVFFGYLKNIDISNNEEILLPMIHVYSFSEVDEEKSKEKLAERIKKKLPNFEKNDIKIFHTIKDVSTLKKMYSISFRIRIEDALGENTGENIVKKIKI